VDALVDAANAEARRNTKGSRNAPKGNRSKFNVLSDVLNEVAQAENVDPDVEHSVEAEPVVVAHLGLFSAGRVVGILANEEVKEGHEAETCEEGEEGPERVSRLLVGIDAQVDSGGGNQIHDVGESVDEVYHSSALAVEH
jgi:hypothetical protein